MGRRSRRRQHERDRSPHPGVKIVSRTHESGRVTWRARWVDPYTGRERSLAFSKLRPAITNADGRKAWAISKAKTLSEARAALEAGDIVGGQAVPLDIAVSSYLERCEAELRPATVATYAESLRRLQAWAASRGVESLRSLTGPLLCLLRDYLIALPSTRIVAGRKRGSRAATEKKRSPVTVNRDLRAIRTFLLKERRRGTLSEVVGSDTITDALTNLRQPRKKPDPLSRAEVRQLLEAALRHDRETYKMTRQEKEAGRAGATLRHKQAAPLFLAALLTGMRARELRELKWSAVSLEDSGAIRVRADTTKVASERIVDLSVCPSLLTLLARMRLQAANQESVFDLTEAEMDALRDRPRQAYGAPKRATLQRMRSTASSFLTNAPGIYGGASVYRSAAQLGHGVDVAQESYLGLIRDIPHEASTLEEAMGIEDLAMAIAAGDRQQQEAA